MYMRYLVLSIYNKSDCYDEMLKVQQEYINNNPDVDAYFITFDNKIDEDVKLIDNIIYVKGTESLTNIYLKTIKALDYVTSKLGKTYDYIVRTTVSTVINYKKLFDYLSKAPRTNLYIGGPLLCLKWRLVPGEISISKREQSNDYYGLHYIQGIGIILSSDIACELVKISKDIEYDIVNDVKIADDVKIAILVRTFLPYAYKGLFIFPHAKVTHNTLDVDSVFIRHKTNDRLNDVKNMSNVVRKIYRKEA